MKPIIQFKNLADIDKSLKNEKTCRAYYEQIRWGGVVVCPHCEGTKIYVLKPSKCQNEYKCANKECFKKFNVLTKTIFENTKISLIIWFKAIHLATTLSKGISSTNLSYQLGITQKTAWFVLHRIREMLKEKARVILEGEVEVDEVWIGGKDKNKSKSKRKNKAGVPSDKIPVVGLVQRGGKLFCLPVPRVLKNKVLPIMVATVKPHSTIYTDQWAGYKSLKNNFDHFTVDHGIDEYVRGNVHTNTIEGAWGLFKRKITGIHHQVSPKHLERYCVEFSFSYNYRKLPQYEKFNEALKRADTRLLYKELIAN